MNVLFILNDPPYGTERSFNALRLALEMAKEDSKPDISVFLMADAVVCAKNGQKTPDGYYNLGRMIKGAARNGRVVLCGTCMDARGLTDAELVPGPERGTMADLSRMTMDADKVLVF
ncbi:MAG: DsrE family protein [Rhodospirillales bacterium]|nr:DsrE family protein [Rhodospirillales bacterium]